MPIQLSDSCVYGNAPGDEPQLQRSKETRARVCFNRQSFAGVAWLLAGRYLAAGEEATVVPLLLPPPPLLLLLMTMPLMLLLLLLFTLLLLLLLLTPPLLLLLLLPTLLLLPLPVLVLLPPQRTGKFQNEPLQDNNSSNYRPAIESRDTGRRSQTRTLHACLYYVIVWPSHATPNPPHHTS